MPKFPHHINDLDAKLMLLTCRLNGPGLRHNIWRPPLLMTCMIASMKLWTTMMSSYVAGRSTLVFWKMYASPNFWSLKIYIYSNTTWGWSNFVEDIMHGRCSLICWYVLFICSCQQLLLRTLRLISDNYYLWFEFKFQINLNIWEREK